jgi:TonB family protein
MRTSLRGLRPPSQIRWMRLFVSSVVAVQSAVHSAGAADEAWVEMRSAHFQVISNASEGNTRTLTWQLEQIRNVIAALWPWARVDLSRPLGVIAVKDESSMRALAPAYWEGKGDIRPVSVWVTGADRPYLVIRADLRGDDRNTLNPHISAYYSYVSLVLQSSLARDLPLWLGRGLAGVVSNTVVRDNFILLGPPIPWHLQRMRSGSRLSLNQLVAVTRSSPEFTQGDRLLAFDAQSWAFVHYLMFGRDGSQRRQLDQLIALINQGTDPAIALKEALGPVEAFEGPLNFYVNQAIFPYVKAPLDVSVKREAFNVRPLSASEAAAARATFHVATRRPLEARALIGAARKVDPSAAATDVAEGLLLDSEGNKDEARKAYANAVERGSTNPHAYFRLASLESGPNPDRGTLLQMEKHLTRAVELNDRLAAAYAYLAEVRVALDPKTDGALPLARRAIALEPAEPGHHLAAARILWRKGNYDDARNEAQTALSLSRTDQERDGAQRVIKGVDAAKMQAAKPKAAESDASARTEGVTAPAPGTDVLERLGDASLLKASASDVEQRLGKPSHVDGRRWTYDTPKGALLVYFDEANLVVDVRQQNRATRPSQGGSVSDALRNLQRYQQGDSGQVGPEIQFDTKGVEFGPWIRYFIAQVKRNWFIPDAAMSMKGHVVLTFNVHKDGSITDLTVAGPSAVDTFNNAAFGALTGANPTQPLPPEYSAEKAFFTVTFYYNEVPPRL